MEQRAENMIAGFRFDLQSGGYDLHLIRIKGSEVTLRLTGACGGCCMGLEPIAEWISKKIMDSMPEVNKVVVFQ